jgi:hypothetical protein
VCEFFYVLKLYAEEGDTVYPPVYLWFDRAFIFSVYVDRFIRGPFEKFVYCLQCAAVMQREA